MVEAQTTSPLSVDQTLDEHAGALVAYVDQQRAYKSQLEDELAQVTERIKRGEKAVAALRPSAPPELPAPKSDNEQRARRRAVVAKWVPSESKIAQVREGLERYGNEHPNGISISALAAKVGISDETVKRSLDVLRQRGEARFLGRREFPTKDPGRPSRAKAYKPMPRHDEHELDEATEALVMDLNEAGDDSNG